MCSTPDMPEMPVPIKADPVIKGDDNSGNSSVKGMRAKIAAAYGADSMNKTGGLGLSGPVSSAGKTALGA